MVEGKTTQEAQEPGDQEVGIQETGEIQELKRQSDIIKEPCK